DPAVWEAVLSSIYAGNASDPKEGTIFWGEKLTQLGFQFGTSARSHDNVFIEAGFLPLLLLAVPQGNTLYLMVPASTCIAKNISTTRALCLAEFTRAYLAGVAQAQPLLRSLPPCSRDFVGNTSQLLSVNDLQVLCTETTVVPMADATDLEAKLYCGYFQAKCNSSNLYNNLYSTAFDFQAASLNALSFNAYYNDTLLIADNAGSNLRLPSLVTAAVSSWWSQVTGSTEVTNPLQLLGVMSMPKLKTKVTLDFSSLLGPLFFTWVVQLLLPTILQQLVYEKEKRLRMMMKMHGLEDTTYWSVTYLWFLVVYCIYILVFLVMGYITRLAIFTKTDLLIQIVTYFLHGNCMLAFCVLLSSLFINARTAIVVAFLYVFGSGLIGDLLFKTFMDQDKDWILFVQWVPAWSLYRCLYEMAAYAQLAVYRDERMGLQWSNLGDAGNGMPTAWIIFVLGNGTGVRRHPLFFLDRIRGKNKAAATHQASGRASLELAAGAHGAHANHDAHPVMMLADGDPADVMAERLRVEALADYSNHPIVVRDIKKVFPAMDGGKPKVAVRTMTLGIQRGECFGLLGPNGAGKTTTINMLTGFLEPSGGGGVIEGLDIRTQMQDVYKLMGVCPQHDLLWEQLTGREHLHFFGRLKGL
ncbi:ABC transporter domain-containing protein, partial [Haematococcus lacustris]